MGQERGKTKRTKEKSSRAPPDSDPEQRDPLVVETPSPALMGGSYSMEVGHIDKLAFGGPSWAQPLALCDRHSVPRELSHCESTSHHRHMPVGPESGRG